MVDDTPIVGLEHLAPFARVAILGFDLAEADPDLDRLRRALPTAQIISFTDGTAPATIERAPKSTARALIAARRIRADAVVLADDARKLAVLGFATGATVFVSRAGCIVPRSGRSFVEERSPMLETVSVARRVRELADLATVAPTGRQKFFIVSCSRHAGEAALHCLTSVAAQDYPKDLVEHVYLDDDSDDDTPARVQAWLAQRPEHRVRYIRTNKRRGGTRNTRDLFRTAPAGSIVLELNGDDWLPDPEVLTFLDRVYADDAVWMTYNSAVHASGARFSGTHPYDEATVESSSYRGAVWRAGHLRTFRAELFDHVDDELLKDPASGDWWASADDQAIYLAMLELAGRHAKHLTRTTYVYNRHDASEDQQDLAGGRRRAARIRGQAALRPLVSLPARKSNHEDDRVSIVMPMLDDADTIEAAMQSVLEQRYRNIELIVIDDGSTDASVKIAQRIADADGRVVVAELEGEGLAAALNYGLDIATGAIVARAESMDISHPDRLVRQVAVLHAEPRIGAVGSWIERIGDNGRPLGAPWQTPALPDAAGWLLCFEPCFAPGAMTMRRRLIEQIGRYDIETVDDIEYEMWLRLAKITAMTNVAAPLVGARRADDDTPPLSFARLGARHVQSILGRPIGDATSSDFFHLHRRSFDEPPKAPHLTYETLDVLYRTYVSRRRLPDSALIVIRFDAAKKFLWLAAWCAPTDPSLAVRALTTAERIDGGALLQRGTHRALRSVRDALRRLRR